MTKKVAGTAILACIICAGTCMAAQTDEFTFRNGVTWGMSLADVIAAENITEEPEDRMMLPDGKEMLLLEDEDVTAAGLEADSEYIFVDDALYVCGYEFGDETDIDKLLESMEAKYGVSQPVNWELFAKLMTPLFPDEIESQMSYMQSVEFSCEWDIDEQLYIMLYSDGGDIDLAYFDRADLLAWADEPYEEAATDAVNTAGL